MTTRDLTANTTGTSLAFNILLLEEGSLKFRRSLKNIWKYIHISIYPKRSSPFASFDLGPNMAKHQHQLSTPEIPEGFRTLALSSAQGREFISGVSAFALGPHSTLWTPSTQPVQVQFQDECLVDEKAGAGLLSFLEVREHLPS